MARKNETDFFREIWEQMTIDMIHSLKRNFMRHTREELEEGFRWEQWQLVKLREMAAYQRRNRKILGRYSPKIEREVKRILGQSFRDALKNFGRSARKVLRFNLPASTISQDVIVPRAPEEIALLSNEEVLREALNLPRAEREENFFGINEKKLEALQNTVLRDMEEAQSSALRKMNDVYRQTIVKASMHMATGTKTLNQAVDMATKDFLAAGINSITYSDGKQVNVASYAEMALRTASQRATFLAEGQKRNEWGVYTVFVSAHANTCEKCKPWQGLVLIDDVFANGKPDGVHPLLSEAIAAGLLHPNCRHTIATYFPGITQLPVVPDEETIDRNYEAEQRQRYIERQIRKWKRVYTGSLDENNQRHALAQVGKWQAEMKEHLAAHPEMRRDYSREHIEGFDRSDTAAASRAHRRELEKYTKRQYNDDGTIYVTDDWKNREHPNIPREYKPYAIIETVSGVNRQVDRMIYDGNGKQKIHINSGPHSNPDQHPYGVSGEHAHSIIWDDDKIINRVQRELTEKERKEHSDIL